MPQQPTTPAAPDPASAPAQQAGSPGRNASRQSQRRPARPGAGTGPARAPVPVLERAAAYLAAMPPSIQGQGGDHALFAAAAALTRGFALGEAEAFPLLAGWNSARSVPPWPEAVLRQKLRSTAATAAAAARPRGYLLQEQAPAARAHGARPLKTARAAAPSPSTTAADAVPLLRVTATQAQRRAQWPAFHRATPEEIHAIATQRGVDAEAVRLLEGWGFLSTAVVEGHPCYLLHERAVFAQARRLDGEPFTRFDGALLKTKNLPGSEGAFLGRKWAGRAPNVLLVEGCIGLLEALALWVRLPEAAARQWSLLAATSASARFARDPELLQWLRHCRVRILPDGDAAGRRAALSWFADLEAARIRAQILPLPEDCKDLGPLLVQPCPHPGFVQALFSR